MITKSNFKNLLKMLGFIEEGSIFQKSIGAVDLKVDFSKQSIIYPEDRRLIVNRRDTCNFSHPENFVVFECIHRLLEKGYKPEHLELEPKWKVGHGASGGRADILVRDHEKNPLLVIECKTEGDEFDRAWRKTLQNGDQLFSYAQQIPQTQYLCLYASDFVDDKIRIDQRIIAHRDNEKILAQNETLRRFSEATDVEDRYAVWRNTYERECTEGGIFEENIQPYQIGKDKFVLETDTTPIDADDKEGQYHRFRTILRQHNIARREQAFEVLVNLFLCKLVDEEDNKTDLQFSWKGIAYDNYFDFVDRLQNLYKTGMNKFLGKKISYISNEQIDNAFWAVRNDTNATKKQIQKYFKELKFYTNSAFSLMDTHNEDLFKRNAKVLLEIVQMWQKIRLKIDEQNQFLGEMFELFLDDGVKQSEGQFFTPLPICKFIVGSLPLAQKIKENLEPLKAIDYACGSGHFLNEYAYQIKPLVEKEERNVSDYYSQIIGIEKEDRLAKVAKVAAYMHGQEQIKILDTDALASHTEIQRESYDVLVANPPFSVKEFLHTLSKENKQQYQLIQATGEDSDTNTIQCFFLERIHHLIACNGVVGVIVPSTILNGTNNAVYTSTREILLQYFDLVSIAELGESAFCETDTDTVVLFLKRKIPRPEPADQYRNRVKNYFEGDEEKIQYQDYALIQAYCNHIEIPYEEYTKLFDQNNLEPLAKLLEYEIFKEYERDFNQNKELKKIKKSREFRKKTEAEQAAECGRRFINYLHAIEKEKLYYFILAHMQAGKVLIVKAPIKKEQKQFLGYEWSNRKGKEGIKYIGGDTVNEMITPLFDPKDLDNDTKINTAIKRNFIGKITDPLPEHCHYADLTDMLDFSGKDFKKVINLNPQQSTDIETKWEQQTIDNLLIKVEENKTQIQKSQILEEGETAVVTQEKDLIISGYTNTKEVITDLPLIVFGDHSCTFKYIDFPFIRGADGTQLLKIDENKLIPKCFYYLVQLVEIPNKNKYERHFKYLKKIKIPVPPLHIQWKIVDECEAVDQGTNQARQTIITAKQQIEESVGSVEKASMLNEVVDRISDTVNPKEKNVPAYYVGLENIESQTGVLLGDTLSDFSMIKSNKNVFRKGDILYGKLRPNLNKVHLAQVDGICSTDILVFRPYNPNLATFYKHYFLSEGFNSEVIKTVSGQQLPRTSWKKIERILVPSSDVQQQLVSEVEQLESGITEAQAMIDKATERKNVILKKYL